MSITISNNNSWNGSQNIVSFGEPSTQVYLALLSFNQQLKVNNFTLKIKNYVGSNSLIVKPVILTASSTTLQNIVFSGDNVTLSSNYTDFTDVTFNLGKTLSAGQLYAIGLTTVNLANGNDLNAVGIDTRFRFGYTNCDNCFTGSITSDESFAYKNNPTTIPFNYQQLSNTSRTLVMAISATIIHYTANICFLAGSKVYTDQGKIDIEKLVPDVNTIDNKKIVTITESVMNDDLIVKIKKDALSKNVPNKDTLISGLHKVYIKGKLIEAYKLASFYKNIKYIPYKGEKLYNVLMENWEMMKVNNMTVETLHPENIIAKLHNSKLTESKKAQLLVEISQVVINEDYQKFDFIKNYILKY
tara:strand:- start:58 stop:1131 length:1074 start_codon:yes stop_codon:yes gene_type:complete